MLSLRFQQSLKFYTEIFASVKKSEIFLLRRFQQLRAPRFVLLSSAEPTIMARLFVLPNCDSTFLQTTRAG